VGEIANQSVPAYGEMDARLAWRPLPALEWALVGQNLLHRQHPEFGTATSRKELKRGVYGTITWRF
jgi:iron complex outermembrane receptor protein